MTTEQESRLSMYQEIMGLVNNNLPIVTPLPYSSEFITTMTGVISQIILNGEKQDLDITGIAAIKKQLRTIIEFKGLDIALKVVAYATLNGKLPLLNEAKKYTKTELTHCADNILKIHCECIYDLANDNIADLATYGIDATMLSDFQTDINNYYDTIATPTISIADRKVITDTIRYLFIAGDAAMKKADAMVEVVRITEPAFYVEYKNLRKITNTGARTMALKGTAVNNKNKGIQGVRFEFAQQETSVVIVKETYIKGGFNIQDMPDGVWDVTITKVGYVSQQTTVVVDNITMVKLNVTMLKS